MTFCSLSGNQISDEGAREFAAALQVNQSLQTLEWVQPFMSYFCYIEDLMMPLALTIMPVFV